MLRIALAGNPNSGKTTLFNALTGSTAHVGNWPGVTVDKKEGVYKKNGIEVEIVDLPGIYSLSPYTPEEVVARNYILEEKPDCVINIVDVTNLERNLYLTTQLMELDVPLVIALNMTDVLEKNGDSIDEKMLERRLGFPVAKISALREKGMVDLMEKTLKAAQTKRTGYTVLSECVVGKAIVNAENALKLKGVNSPLFHAIKLVEKDELEVMAHPAEAMAVEEFVKINCVTDNGYDCDTEAVIADARYKHIVKNYSVAVTKAKRPDGDEMTRSDKADKILTHKWASIPLFLVIMFAVFHVTFSENFLYLANIIPSFGAWCERIAELENPWLSIFFAEGLNSPGAILYYFLDVVMSTIGDGVSAVMSSSGASPWLVGFICDGILGGVFAVMGFLPQIIILFLCFSILEDTGYMARVAFILDRIFRRFGVSGRAFMPMIMGFGCSIPAMANTRTLADEKERTATIRVIPFFSCGAKLPILTAVAGGIGILLGLDGVEFITYGMYVIGIIIAFIALILMRSTTMRGDTTPFIMELPVYHMPRFKNLMLHLWDKAKHFIQKAFTIVLLSTIVLWLLSNFSWNWEFLMEEIDGEMLNVRMNESILGSLGMFIQPIFTPLGFGSQLGKWGWVFAVAAVTGLIAKENVIATFGALAACVTGAVVASETGVDEVWTMIQATGAQTPALIAFIIFNMTTIPCFAAVAAAKAELREGTFKWTLLFWLAVSYIASAAIYTIGSWWWTSFIWAAVVAVAIVGIVFYNKYADKKAAKQISLKH